MISVTDRAKDLLYDVLQQAEQQGGIAPDGEVAIRLAPTSISEDTASPEVELGLGLDHAQDGDQVVEHNGKTVLLVDGSTKDLLDGTTLDVVETPEGQQLTLTQA